MGVRRRWWRLGEGLAGEKADGLGHGGLKGPSEWGVFGAVGWEDLTVVEEGCKQTKEVSRVAHKLEYCWSYPFLKHMSWAARVHLKLEGLKALLRGSMPQMTGSSRLEAGEDESH